MTKSSSSKKGTEGLTERATYAYDYRGLLVKKTYSEFTADEGVSITGGSTVKVTEWYEYTQDGRLLYTEKSAGSVTTETDYIWAETTLWCEVDDGEVYYHHTDHLGTTEAVTDSKGKVVWHAEYEAFGSVLSENGSMAFTPSFTGKMMDECSGLYYFNARWYDSECGRFTTSDPVRDGVNFHNYCNGNPLTRIDWTGLEFKVIPDSKAKNPVNKDDINKTKEMLKRILESDTLAGENFRELDKSSRIIVISVNTDRNNDSSPGDDTSVTYEESIASGDGTGGNVYVRFDPTDDTYLSDGTRSDPESTLAHEVGGHAFYQANGMNPYYENDIWNDEPREIQACLIENEYRISIGLPQRQKYGVGGRGPNLEGYDIPQIPIDLSK